ncbi:MAG: flavodoxin family protein [Spirochaetes bacterium]|nr:flavodoxin family protein [Spirochaetota bacterium]
MPVSGKTEIKVLALFGSPRKTGASSTLHESLLAALGPAEVKRVFLYDVAIHPCTACGHCTTRKECVFSDDMTPLYDALEEADLLSISMPLYFSSPPGPLKLFIDRSQVLWESRRRGERTGKRQTGNLLCTGGASYRNMFLPTITIIRHFFNALEFVYRREDFLLCANMEGRHAGDIPEKYLSGARRLGTSFRLRLSR